MERPARPRSRLWPIVAACLATLVLAGCVQEGPKLRWTPIPRPPADDPTPQGIAYVCEGLKEVRVIYAKNRASVTLADKTWRLEYQAGTDGFRYSDSNAEWSGRDELAALRQAGSNAAPLAYNCRPTRRLT